MRKNFLSFITLVIANIIPIIGVIYFGWDIFPIVYIYFLETIVIGLFGFLKIILAEGVDYTIEQGFISQILLSQFFPKLNSGSSKGSVLVSYFICLIFYTGLLFVLCLLVLTPSNFAKSWEPSYLVAVAGFIISHGVSFYQNYIKNQEYAYAVPYTQMTQPFDRVMVMILVFSITAFAIYRIDVSTLTILALIIIKIIFDIIAHYQEHAKYRDLIENILIKKLPGRDSNPD